MAGRVGEASLSNWKPSLSNPVMGVVVGQPPASSQPSMEAAAAAKAKAKLAVLELYTAFSFNADGFCSQGSSQAGAGAGAGAAAGGMPKGAGRLNLSLSHRFQMGESPACLLASQKWGDNEGP